MIYIALLFILPFVKKSTEFLLVVMGETICKDHYKNEMYNKGSLRSVVCLIQITISLVT